jgi:hypothetical protein
MPDLRIAEAVMTEPVASASKPSPNIASATGSDRRPSTTSNNAALLSGCEATACRPNVSAP